MAIKSNPLEGTSEGIELNTYPPPPVHPSSRDSSAERTGNSTTVQTPPLDTSAGIWAWITAGWLTLLAIPLLLFPRFVLFLSTPSTTSPVNHRDELTALESFLCTHVGIGLLAVAIGLVTSIPDPPPISRTLPSDPVSGHPLLIPLSLALSLTSFIAYNTYQIGALGLLITIGCGFTGLFGLWVVLFQGTGNFSRKTGADKHTSSFLFSSKASASQQKKLWKKERERELEEQERLRWKK